MTLSTDIYSNGFMDIVHSYLDKQLTLEECMELCHLHFEYYRKEKNVK